MKREEHYSVYRAILMAQGVEDRRKKIFFFEQFFSTCEKITQFWNFVTIKVAKFKLNHLGFYCKASLF